MRIECIYDEPAILGESPLWHPTEQVLYWVDIEKPALHCWNPQTQQHRMWCMPTAIGCIGLRAIGGLVAAMGYGFASITLPRGEVTLLASPLTGVEGVLFNDGKCDRAGRFWAGTKDRVEQADIGSLYKLDTHSHCTEMAKGFAVTNGVAWSPDNTIFYVCNSPARLIYQYDFALESGTLHNKRVFAELPVESGYPDGLTVDSEGGIWNAHWDGWRVTRYLPNGKIDRVIEMPVRRPTSCCFGGVDLQTLYVTSASTRMSVEELAQNPQAGVCICNGSGSERIARAFFSGLNL